METKNINKLHLNNYYVYQHSINGKVFYVGKGSGTRAVDFRYRSRKWNELIGEDLDLVEVEIIKTFDCEKEALTYEKSLIESLSSSGVNLTNTTHNYKPGRNKKDNPKKIEKSKEHIQIIELKTYTTKELCEALNIKKSTFKSHKKKILKNYEYEEAKVGRSKVYTLINYKEEKSIFIKLCEELANEEVSFPNEKTAERILEKLFQIDYTILDNESIGSEVGLGRHTVGVYINLFREYKILPHMFNDLEKALNHFYKYPVDQS